MHTGRRSAVEHAAREITIRNGILTLCAVSTAALVLSGCGSGSPRASADAGGAPTSGPVALQIRDAAGRAVFGDPERGKQAFVACSACHSIHAGMNMVGPSLHGVIGRRAGTAPDFQYSAANRRSGIVWTEQALWTYLENPQKVVPGTYMTYIGLKDPQQRADVIAYLQEAAK